MPVVMNPWELDSYFSLLFADAVPHPNLNQVRARTQRFLRTWRGLWFRYGDRPEGHDEFRRALSAYLEEINAVAKPLMLNNELNWFGAMRIMVAAPQCDHRLLRRNPVRASTATTVSHQG